MASMHRLTNEPDCNVVDVLGANGMFQHGKIVDCAEGGLMIDWECKGFPASQFVPFERVYRRVFDLQNFTDGQAIAQGRTSVEVLLHRSGNGPRTWYPGTLLAVFSDRHKHHFGLVQAAVPNAPVTIVARGDRIRSPRTESELKQLRVQKDQFVKHRLGMPKGYNRGAASAKEIVDILNEPNGGSFARTRTLIRAVSMDDKTLEFISVGNKYMPIGWRIPVKRAGDKLRSLLEEAGKTYEFRQKQLKRKFCEVDQELPEEAGMHSDIPSATTAGLRLLPRDILSCLFDYLDSAEQSRLRRVCAYWDYMLTLPSVTQAVRVSYTDKFPSYLSVASLHHAWTPHTKLIMNASFYCTNDVVMHSDHAEPLCCSGRLFRTLVQNNLHAPVERLVLSDVFWSLEADRYGMLKIGISDAVDHFVEELNGLAGACQTMILRHVKAHLTYRLHAFDDSFNSRKFASVHILAGRVAGCLSVKELWSRMDASLPPLNYVQRQHVLTGVKSMPSKVLRILNDIQSCDPRDDANYRGREWTWNDLDNLELEKLSKVTLYYLGLDDRKETAKFVLSW